MTIIKVSEERGQVVEVDMETEVVEIKDREVIITMPKEAIDQEMKRRDIRRKISNLLSKTSLLLIEHFLDKFDS